MVQTGEAEQKVSAVSTGYTVSQGRPSRSASIRFGLPSSTQYESGAGILIPVASEAGLGSDDGIDGPLATWDGNTIRWAEPAVVFGIGPATEHDISYHRFSRFPDDGLELTDEGAAAARAWMAPWIDDVLANLIDVVDADLQALANLQALAADLDSVERVACALLGTTWVRADEAITGRLSNNAVLGTFADEVSAQYLLLLLEYIEVMVKHLERPEVDWMEGDGVTFGTGFTAGNTDAGFLGFFASAAYAIADLTDPQVVRSDVVGVD